MDRVFGAHSLPVRDCKRDCKPRLPRFRDGSALVIRPRLLWASSGSRSMHSTRPFPLLTQPLRTCRQLMLDPPVSERALSRHLDKATPEERRVWTSGWSPPRPSPAGTRGCCFAASPRRANETSQQDVRLNLDFFRRYRDGWLQALEIDPNPMARRFDWSPSSRPGVGSCGCLRR